MTTENETVDSLRGEVHDLIRHDVLGPARPFVIALLGGFSQGLLGFRQSLPEGRPPYNHEGLDDAHNIGLRLGLIVARNNTPETTP